MNSKICSYCGTSIGEINFDIFTEKFYCEKEDCKNKAKAETKNYFKERERKISREFKITNIKSENEFEDMLYALYGLLDKMGKTKELGAMNEPDFFKNKSLYLIASEIPEEYISIKMGEIDKTKVKIKILKEIPAEVIKEAMKKAKFIE